MTKRLRKTHAQQRPPESTRDEDLRRLEAERTALLEDVRILEASRDQYVQLFEESGLPMLLLDGTLRIRHANGAACELLNDRERRLQGRFFRVLLIDEASRRTLSDHIAHANRNDSGGGLAELQLMRMDGSKVPVRLFTRFLRGDVRRIQMVLLDLTDREQERRRYRELFEAEHKARSEAMAKDRFIAMMSHELRTPLTPALAAVSTLQARDDLPAESRKLLEIAQRNLVSEARLIDDLLDVSRIVSGKMRIVREPLDLHEVVQDCVDGLKGEAESKAQIVEISLAASRHHVNADPLRLRQVIANLLRNAIKFTHQTGTIRISSWNNGERIAVEVQDNGVGIDQQMLTRVFEPFAQDEQRPPDQGGLGLGLAISKGLIELHEGMLSAASRGPGQGARFVIELFTIDAPVVLGAPVLDVEARAPATSRSPKRRVLLVEDDADTANVMAWALSDRGYEVEAANSLKSALDVDLEHVDVIVSDLGLPDGTGLELMQKLKHRGHKPAIALSGFGMESDVKASKDAGFDMHLTKPVKVQQLIEAIESL